MRFSCFSSSPSTSIPRPRRSITMAKHVNLTGMNMLAMHQVSSSNGLSDALAAMALVAKEDETQNLAKDWKGADFINVCMDLTLNIEVSDDTDVPVKHTLTLYVTTA